MTSEHWLTLWVSALGGSDQPTQPSVGSAAASVARSALQSASAVLALAALGALLPYPWSIRSQVALATLDLVLLLQPYRINLADPDIILAEAQPLRGQARAAWVGGNGAMLANYGPLLRVTLPDGYSALANNDYANLLTGADQPMIIEAESADNPALPLLGYSTIVDSRQHTVNVVAPPPPRAWVARCVWPGDALEVRKPGFPRNACVARKSATAREQPATAAPANLLAERSGWQTLAAEGPGWLVTTEPWYPGWTASIDGRPAQIEPVDGTLVGVELPTGAHTISISYRPAGLELGLLISLFSACVLVVIAKLDVDGERLAVLLGRLNRRREV
jgi:hypothetical protein